MKKFLNEFKQFALKGSVIDLAVGVLIGGAFQGIVKSLTTDIISPIIGIFANKDFSDLTLNIFGVTVKYGSFITAVINFLIMALLIFLLVKGMNKLSDFGKRNKAEEITESSTKKCPFCYTEIDIKATRCPNCTSKLEVIQEV
ncbi:UNVERIFIED_ORG: mechanosensitive ion channel protein MscL [Clostridium botulinum]|uniref:large conductance mechanosensitive channel protein MscL n=1 Tax=Clostridium botulinum TaxID=1491 RepID=UPI000363228B|nr:large conductance mechanosensitive channel protein MscL [Clostridium botulinum]KIL07072.1 mechanosensitive ion channel protein MscL [Clostridium botulinum]MBN1035370.1 large conductance mechanosensitive channel protein MscL [Clostridium botulinum]MBN1058377.1 large conductance mechanosensitive channel protein MscL [Clostridium botulinum]MBN1061673.1 large conductance mechanosensitive channel protein MscL [Clostridium botulinum]MBN1064738.1 large conductance mechanosensitive channel protein 